MESMTRLSSYYDQFKEVLPEESESAHVHQTIISEWIFISALCRLLRPPPLPQHQQCS